MATYHLSAKTISRSHGRSATGAAAYRTGARIIDERTGIVHDYQRRRGVEATFVLLPTNAPDWASDRARLWNAAEQAETRKNSTVAREFEIALPAELDTEQRRRLAADFARELVLRHGCAADVAIHRPGRAGDSRNHHAHILLTTRRLTAAGFAEKTRELDDLKSGEIGRWRERFAQLQNERLRDAGIYARVDHRSLETQGIDREATTHLGPVATAMERRGIPSDRGDNNRQAEANNRKRVQLQTRITELQAMVEQQQQEEQKRRWEKARKEQEDRMAQRPEMIKAAWQAEQVRQFELIAAKAHQIRPRIVQHVERQKRTVTAHDQKRPKPPWGLFVGLRMTAYRQKLIAWRDQHAKLENRLNQLENRLSLVDECMRQSVIPLYPTKGEHLATRKAAAARPDLAEKLQQLREQEKAALVAQYQAKIAPQQTRPRGRSR